jgi:hypothetical protein
MDFPVMFLKGLSIRMVVIYEIFVLLLKVSSIFTDSYV